MLKSATIALLGIGIAGVTGLTVLFAAAQRTRLLGRAERPEPADAVIILGAYTDGYRPSKALTARLRAGLHLYRLGYAAYFIVSGGRGADETISEASSMRRFLILNGVPPESILMERHSTDTWENLWNTRQLMSSHQLQSGIIVTSDYHLPRALAVARQLDMRVCGYCAPSQKSEFRYAIREVVARVKYTLTGQAVSYRKEP